MNLKGGVAKTQSSLGIAASLPGKVLLIDLDPQGNAGLQSGADLSRGMYEFFVEKTSLSSLIQTTKHFDIVTSNLQSSLIEVRTAGRFKREFLLKQAIEKLDYDYVVIDCPPAFNILTTNAVVAADKIFVPAFSEPLSLTGMNLLNSALDEINRTFDKVFLTRFDARTKVQRLIQKELGEVLGNKLCQQTIRQATEINDLAYQMLNPIEAKGEIRNDFKKLTDELLK